jgi:hypothetical protein
MSIHDLTFKTKEEAAEYAKQLDGEAKATFHRLHGLPELDYTAFHIRSREIAEDWHNKQKYGPRGLGA